MIPLELSERNGGRTAHPIRLDRITTQAMDMDRVKLLGQVKEIKLTAALPVVPVANVGPRTAAEHLTKFTLESAGEKPEEQRLQGLISVSRAKLEMNRFTTTVPIRQARVFYIRRKTMRISKKHVRVWSLCQDWTYQMLVTKGRGKS